MNQKTGFLYARPSFIEGMSRLIDFGNTLQIYNSPLSPQQADFLALSADWSVVGDDLRNAMTQYDNLHENDETDLLSQARKAILTRLESEP